MISDAIDKVKEIVLRLGTGTKFLFFDFDGTLSVFAGNPDEAIPVLGAVESLENAAKLESCFVSIISGRNISDLTRIFPADKFILCGNHGAQIQGKGIDYMHKSNTAEIREVNRIISMASATLGWIPGFLLEKKEFSAVAHYRKTDDKSAAEIEGWFEIIAKQDLKSVRIRKGKKVFEILPNSSAGKADAVMFIADRLQGKTEKPGILFAGDDTTDEEAFADLGGKAVKIFVGKNGHALADYSLMGPENVVEFINKLIEALRSQNV